MRVALVHDHLFTFGGAERVLKELHAMFPDAPVYTLFVHDRMVQEYFPDADIRTTFLNLPRLFHRWRRTALPFIPFAVESMDLRDYDVVLSSASGFVKGVVTRSHTTHICYCHTPPRFLWEDRAEYGRRHIPRLVTPFAAPIVHLLRLWDQHAAQRVDRFLANSQYTADRIRRYYRRDATVVAPPVDVSVHSCRVQTRRDFGLPDEFFLFVGRLVWWKRPELVIEAFNRLGLPLIVVGEGPLRRRLAYGAGKNIRFLGGQPDAVVRELMGAARGCLHPQVEDFGMAAVEAMAEGTPVVAFRAGGALETVQEGVSGEFFDDADPVALADAVRRLREGWRSGKYDRENIHSSVQRFSPGRFRQAVRRELENIRR